MWSDAFPTSRMFFCLVKKKREEEQFLIWSNWPRDGNWTSNINKTSKLANLTWRSFQLESRTNHKKHKTGNLRRVFNCQDDFEPLITCWSHVDPLMQSGSTVFSLKSRIASLASLSCHHFSPHNTPTLPLSLCRTQVALLHHHHWLVTSCCFWTVADYWL